MVAGVTPAGRSAVVARLATAALGVAGAATAVLLASGDDDFAPSSAAVIALGVVMFTLIAIVGVLLVRGRWARVLGVVVALADLALVAMVGLADWGLVATAAALVALGGLVSPPVDGWLRQHPPPDGPDGRAVALALGLLALVPAVGVAAPDGLSAAHGVLGSAGVILGWAYSKAQPWAIWAIRLALPVVAVPAVLAEPWPGGLGLALLVGALVALAWTPQAYAATAPRPGPLPTPAPRRRTR
jgi:hypothetical protein